MGKGKEYTTEDLELLVEIQGISARIGMPGVIAVLKHCSNYIGQSVSKDKILADIKKDDALEDAGYQIIDENINNAIQNLSNDHFLEQKDENIIIKEKGQKAIEILRLKKD